MTPDEREESERAEQQQAADLVVREEVLHLLRGGNAHMSFADAVRQFPMKHINTKFPGGTYTPWHLLEHLRMTQWDILDFIRNAAYQEREWPREYWPPQDQEATEQDWQHTISTFLADGQTLQALAENPATDLYARIPHGTGQTILRELLLVADHNAYHIGEFAIARQMMGTWDKDHR
jgi:DinB superfamily